MDAQLVQQMQRYQGLPTNTPVFPEDEELEEDEWIPWLGILFPPSRLPGVQTDYVPVYLRAQAYRLRYGNESDSPRERYLRNCYVN